MRVKTALVSLVIQYLYYFIAPRGNQGRVSDVLTMSNEINDIYNNSFPPLGATDCFRKLWGLSPIWQDIFMSDGVPYEVFIASEESDNTFLGGSMYHSDG